MGTLLALGIFYTLYGIAGLLGLQVIPEKYRGQAWTPKYIRCRGFSWVLMGIPWLCLWAVVRNTSVDTAVTAIALIACSLPALIYTFVMEHKFKAMLK